VGLLASCGSTSSNNVNNTNNPSAGTPGSGSSSGSGSAGSGSGSGSGTSGSGSGTSTSYVSYAYAASTSAIVGYGVNSDGSLTPLAGSPYAASLVQNTNIVTNGANLYAIAEGDTNLDVFAIDKSSGALTLANTTNAIAGDPNSGDIAFRLALDHTGSSLYAAVGTNIDGGVNVFTVGSTSNAQQVQYLAGPSLPLSPQVFSSNNQFGYASACSARVEGIFGFTRASDGTLKSMNPGTPQGPTGNPGEAFCPHALATSAKGYLAVLWMPFGFASSGQVGTETYVMTYTINADGTLTAVANSQVKTASTSANTVATNFDPTGSFLAVAGDGGVQTFAINANGAPAAVASPQSAGANFQNVAWDNSNHLFAANSSQLYVFNSSTGVLTQASGSPHTGGPELAVFSTK
jgi:6-phosphogluconolactonase (cycloisomerase 2 family)